MHLYIPTNKTSIIQFYLLSYTPALFRVDCFCMKGKEDSGVDYMKIFQAIGDELSYKDNLQLDGAYSVAHINYGESPLFKILMAGILQKIQERTVFLLGDILMMFLAVWMPLMEQSRGIRKQIELNYGSFIGWNI